MDDVTLNAILHELKSLNKSHDRVYSLLEATLKDSRHNVSAKTHAVSILVFAAMMVLSQIQLYDLKKITLNKNTIEVVREQKDEE